MVHSTLFGYVCLCVSGVCLCVSGVCLVCLVCVWCVWGGGARWAVDWCCVTAYVQSCQDLCSVLFGVHNFFLVLHICSFSALLVAAMVHRVCSLSLSLSSPVVSGLSDLISVINVLASSKALSGISGMKPK